MTYLGMQVLIEGLALAAFGLIRNMATEPLGKAINAYVMQDEARHVMFGRLALRDYYPQHTRPSATSARSSASRLAIGCATASSARRCGSASDFRQEVTDYVANSDIMKEFRGYLFLRIVPILKDIGLFGPKVRAGSPTWA